MLWGSLGNSAMTRAATWELEVPKVWDPAARNSMPRAMLMAMCCPKPSREGYCRAVAVGTGAHRRLRRAAGHRWGRRWVAVVMTCCRAVC